MRVLIIHHVEYYFNEQGYFIFAEWLMNAALELQQIDEYDKIIINRSEIEYVQKYDNLLTKLAEKLTPNGEVIEENISWGYDELRYNVSESFIEEYGEDYFDNIPDGTVVDGFVKVYESSYPVPVWLELLQGSENLHVDICGIFDGECMLELENFLDVVGVEYNRLNSLII